MRDAALRERDSSLHAQREVAEGAARRLSLSQAGLGSLHAQLAASREQDAQLDEHRLIFTLTRARTQT